MNILKLEELRDIVNVDNEIPKTTLGNTLQTKILNQIILSNLLLLYLGLFATIRLFTMGN